MGGCCEAGTIAWVVGFADLERGARLARLRDVAARVAPMTGGSPGPVYCARIRAIRSRPSCIVGWVSRALPRELGSLAPTVTDHAARGDAAAVELMRLAATFDVVAARLISLGATRLALSGGLAPRMEEWLSAGTRCRLVAPLGDALDGALQLARLSAQSAAA